MAKKKHSAKGTVALQEEDLGVIAAGANSPALIHLGMTGKHIAKLSNPEDGRGILPEKATDPNRRGR